MAKRQMRSLLVRSLDLLIGNRPLQQSEELDKRRKEAVRANILRLLSETYGIEEEDFLSADLEIVPAGERAIWASTGSMILAYGHDDRVCAFTSVFAMLDLADEITEHTLCCLW